MSRRIRDGLADDLQDIEVQTRGDGDVGRAVFKLAVNLPVAREPLTERARLGSHSGKADDVSPQCRNRRSQVLLLEQHQFLELLKICCDLRPVAYRTADRLDPVGGAGKELDNAVVQV